jgi:hypothetical protein
LRAIAYFFIDLCLLRRRPQDLPASSALLLLVVAAALLGGALLALTARAPLMLGVGQTALDLLLMLGALHLALKLTSKPQRFLQTGTALVGADTVIGLVSLLPVGLAGPSIEESQQLLLVAVLFMALVAWSVVVAGHILRHAFDITLTQGAVVAVAFDIVSYVLIGGLTQSQGAV